MIIGLNGQNLTASKPAGPERYAINVYKNLGKIDKTNIYRLYLSEKPKKGSEISDLANFSNFEIKLIKKRFSWTHTDLGIELLKNPVDVFFTPVHTVPFMKPLRTKYVAMIHGLEYKSNKIYSGVSMKGLLHPFILKYVTSVSDKIIVPSEFTKTALVNSKLVNNIKKISVIHEGVGEEFYPRKNEETVSVKEKYNLSGKEYVLTVSTIQPRKNIPNLVKSFSEVIRDAGLKDTLLVISGKKGWEYQESIDAPAKFNISGNVKFLDWIPQEDLPALISGAAAYINVSVEEGFGLTVLEAMACGTSVIISDIPAHREIGSTYCVYVNPHDTPGIAAAIRDVLLQPERGGITEPAKDYANSFSWEKTARETLDIFTSLVKRP